MRILILSERFPPQTDPRASRWGAIAAHWARAGWEVHVVCGAPDGRSRDERWCQAHVHRVAGGPLPALAERWLAGEPAGRPTESDFALEPGEAAAAPRPKRLAALARRARQFAWRPLWWPDYACLWQRWAWARAFDLLNAGRFERLLSVSNPFSDHATALKLIAAQPQLGWLADLGDPFATAQPPAVNNPRLYRRANRNLEACVLRAAGAVAVTNQATAAAYQRAYPALSERIAVVPPLLSLPLAPPRSARRGDEPRRLVFAGTLYAGLRGPGPLLTLFRALLDAHPLRRFELHLYGRFDECRADLARHSDLAQRGLVVHGPVPRSAVAEALRQADVLVNLGNDHPCQLPSKLVEYAATGKPILHLSARDDDPAREFLRGYRAMLCVGATELGGDTPSRGAALVFLTRPPTPLGPAEVARFIEPYTVEQVAARYGELLAGLGPPRPARSLAGPHRPPTVATSEAVKSHREQRR